MENFNNQQLDYICYSCYMKYHQKKNVLKYYILGLKLTETRFFDHVKSYIFNNKMKPEYAKIFDHLILLDSDEEINSYLESTKKSFKYLKDNILSYFLYYRPELYYFKEEEISKLTKKIENYGIYLYKKDRPKTSINGISQTAKEIVLEFINSKYSIFRFCFNKGISKQIFLRYLNIVKKEDEDLYEEYTYILAQKEARKDEELQQDIYSIIEFIDNNDGKIDLFDLSKLSVYDISEIVKKADQILDPINAKKFRMLVNPLRNIRTLPIHQINALLQTSFKLNINSEIIEVMNDDKQEIIENLKTCGVPVSNETFQEACKRFYSQRKIK